VNRPALGLVWAVALLAGCHRLSVSGRAPLWTLEDPAGDDHGDGDLLYPASGELARGELDLLALRAFPDAGGTTFEAEFARPIRPPDGRTISSTGATLSEVARLGFWTFNLDVYVDVDRVPGAGMLEALPGRVLQLAPESAWDRAVILTPRPAEARDMLATLWAREEKARVITAGAALSGREEAELERASAERVRERVFFPTRVRVLGSRVRFFVPDAFLPGGAAPGHAYAAAVTGADLDLKVDLRALFGGDLAARGLFVLPLAPGVQRERFGGGRINDPGQPRIVDLLSAGAQEPGLLARPTAVIGLVPAPAAP